MVTKEKLVVVNSSMLRHFDYHPVTFHVSLQLPNKVPLRFQYSNKQVLLNCNVCRSMYLTIRLPLSNKTVSLSQKFLESSIPEVLFKLNKIGTFTHILSIFCDYWQKDP